MTMNSFSSKKKTKENGEDSFFRPFLKNERLNTFANKITDHVADRAGESIDKLIDRFFHNKKHHSNQ